MRGLVCLFGLFRGQYAEGYRWMGDIPVRA